MSTATICANELAAQQALAAIKEATTGHEPGMGYALTRYQFFRFLEELWDNSLIPEDWNDECSHDERRRSLLWRHIAAIEAGRVFTDMGSLPSELVIKTSHMEWEYVTTSGTALLAIDHRESNGSISLREENLIDMLEWEQLPDYCLPWDPDLGTLKVPYEGLYRVWIPASRDQPGRTAWTQLRLALSGLPYACWMQEQGTARAQVRDALQPTNA
jgi:hypothetical protein